MKNLILTTPKKDTISIGDMVEVYCPFLSYEKFKEKVKSIDADYCIFEGASGKIQHEWCTRIN